ncbi:MAG: CHASE3 domain-containing protein, partial [Thermoanaerobaculia bacterium]
MLWAAFIGLALLTAAGVAMTVTVLRMEQGEEYIIVQQSRPMLDAVRQMDEALLTLIAATRGYLLSGQTAYQQQYSDAARNFETSTAQAVEHARGEQDRADIEAFAAHFRQVKALTDSEIDLYDKDDKDGAIRKMAETARLRRDAPDYAELIASRIRAEQTAAHERISSLRQWVMMTMVFLGLAIIVLGAVAATRIEAALGESLVRQVRRTETMIAGMADGVLLVDEDGRTVFINPAGQRLLGKSVVGVPITEHAEV